MEILEDGETARVDIDDIGDASSITSAEHSEVQVTSDTEEPWELELGPMGAEEGRSSSFDLDIEFEFEDNEISDLLEDARQFEQSEWEGGDHDCSHITKVGSG